MYQYMLGYRRELGVDLSRLTCQYTSGVELTTVGK